MLRFGFLTASKAIPACVLNICQSRLEIKINLSAPESAHVLRGPEFVCGSSSGEAAVGWMPCAGRKDAMAIKSSTLA
jgi:hypothetical protein